MTDKATEAQHPASQGLHRAATADVLHLVLSAQIAALDCLRPALGAIEQAACAAAAALLAGHRVIYAGAGSSGLMALADCLELAGTFGIAPDRTPMMFAGGAGALLHMQGVAEDDAAAAKADLTRIEPVSGDLVICVSSSGTTPYTIAVARGASIRGARIVGIANLPGSTLLDLADIAVLIDTGPEVIAGSTRLAAATAQKAALNMLSVLMGLRLGHVYDGYMINLTADNAKLTDRAARIVAVISGKDAAIAREALAKTGGAVKPAVLIARGADLSRAMALLAASGGHLAQALAAQDA
ncbi:MAG: N-acetylmuramic acid 6-phosphate etherase [Paracoccaceae bacterium]|nr:N-acetylmuramic acid 6-phosphate etherase [Paracoccaceae bacterium]